MAKDDNFQLYGILAIVFLLLTFKAPQESQNGLFGNIVKRYIEETSASINATARNQAQLASISSIEELLVTQMPGQGGTLGVTIDPATIQDNSVQAYSPPSENYIIDIGFKSNKAVEYTVQPGDLISFIASDYGVTINSILWANNIRDADSISPGQILKIPPVSGVIHIVKSGDTLSSMAAKYDAEQERIVSFNNLNPDESLVVGQEIIIPDGRIAVSSNIVQTTSTVQRFSYLPNLRGFFSMPANGYNWGTIHGRNGVDIANSCGTPVIAAAEGTVNLALASGWNGGFGQYIRVSHSNGTETLYAHLSKVQIGQGTYVGKSQQIGLMGSTGRSTGCHLHFEVHGAKNPLAKY